jgi:hypothetical protein
MGPAKKHTESEDSYESEHFASTDASLSGDGQPSTRGDADMVTTRSQQVGSSATSPGGNGKGRPLYITSLPGPFINMPADELAKLKRVSPMHFTFSTVGVGRASIQSNTVSSYPERKVSTQASVFNSLV